MINNSFFVFTLCVNIVNNFNMKFITLLINIILMKTQKQIQVEKSSNSKKDKKLSYQHVCIKIICKILSYLKKGPVRVLRLEEHCHINSKTCEKHLDFLVKMDWIKDIKEDKRRRFIEITQDGRWYQEKFCKEYEFICQDDFN